MVDATSLYVLAGGAGRRLGGVEKALVPAGGRPLVAAALGLAPMFEHAFLVARPTPGLWALGFDIVADRGPGEGAPAALATALEHASTEWVCALACDMPLLDAAAIAALAAARKGRRAVVAEGGGRRHPLCAIYRREVAPVAREVAARGGRLVDLLDRIDAFAVHFDDPRPLSNVNTKEALARADAELAGPVDESPRRP